MTKNTPPVNKLHSNYRIELDVVLPGIFIGGGSDHDTMLHAGDAMIKQIGRHVDGGRHARLLFDTETQCKHCGTEWSGAVDKNGYPWCCSKAQAWADEAGIVPEPDLSPGTENARMLPAFEAAQDAAIRLSEQERVRFRAWFDEWHKLASPGTADAEQAGTLWHFSRGVGPAACGVGWIHATDEWDKVTCEACLATERAPSPPAPEAAATPDGDA